MAMIPQRPKEHTLSKREYQVIYLISEGFKPDEIADELGIAKKTYDEYRRRAKEKLELSNNVEIVKYAIKNGIYNL